MYLAHAHGIITVVNCMHLWTQAHVLCAGIYPNWSWHLRANFTQGHMDHTFTWCTHTKKQLRRHHISLYTCYNADSSSSTSCSGWKSKHGVQSHCWSRVSLPHSCADLGASQGSYWLLQCTHNHSLGMELHRWHLLPVFRELLHLHYGTSEGASGPADSLDSQWLACPFYPLAESRDVREE